jgi:CheY-like chemotaxis protein
MPTGGTITVQTRQLGREVELQVRDTGIGMDAATRQRAFEPFFTTKAKIGTGLGLATVQGTVQRWGGSITVASAPDQGTAFTLRLPIWTKAKATATVAEISTIILPPGRLLVVDDDPAITRLLLRALAPPHQVDHVADGIQALAKVTTGRYDAVLIDLGIPGLPGDRVARGIRGIDPNVGTILITGWPLASDDPRLGLFDYRLEKPFQELGHLRSVVAHAVDLSRRRRGGSPTSS